MIRPLSSPFLAAPHACRPAPGPLACCAARARPQNQTCCDAPSRTELLCLSRPPPRARDCVLLWIAIGGGTLHGLPPGRACVRSVRARCAPGRRGLVRCAACSYSLMRVHTTVLPHGTVTSASLRQVPGCARCLVAPAPHRTPGNTAARTQHHARALLNATCNISPTHARRIRFE